jgi:hypothetical protein
MAIDLTPQSGPPNSIPPDERLARPARTLPGSKPEAVSATNPNFWVGKTFLFYHPVAVTEEYIHYAEFAVQSNLSVLLVMGVSQTYANMACTEFVRNDLHGTVKIHTTPSPWIEFDVAGDQVFGDTCDPSKDRTITLPGSAWSWFFTQLDSSGMRFEFFNANYRNQGFADCVFRRTK